MGVVCSEDSPSETKSLGTTTTSLGSPTMLKIGAPTTEAKTNLHGILTGKETRGHEGRT
jgi:hypothetical protein